MLNKRIKKTIATSLAIITIAIPFGNAAYAMDSMSNTTYDIYEESYDTENKSLEELLIELENEGFNVDEFISDVENASFNDLTTDEINQLENARGVGSKAVKVAATWLKKNIPTLCNLVKKYLGIKVGGSTLITYIDIFVGVSNSIDNLIYRIVRKVAPTSWKNSTCEKWADVIRAALPI